MFKTILTKTLYEKRWMMLWWTLAGTLLVLFTVSVFPTFKEALGQNLNDVPESLKSLVGDSAAYSTLAGYLDLQVFEQMVLLAVVVGIILGTAQIAGEENEGTLQTLLSLPVSRTSVYLQKLLAVLVVVGVVTTSLFIGSALGAALIHESLNLGRLALATVGAWLLALTFSLLGYAIGAATGKRALAGTVAGLAAFLAFLVPALAEGVKWLQSLDKLSPFHYFNKPMQVGLSAGDIGILAGIGIALAIIGYISFVRRDIYQR